MNDQQHQNEAACGGSALTAVLGNEIERYLRQLAPHQNERQGPTLLREALAEIAGLRQRDTCARVCECTAYRTELRQLREAVRKVMPENWREDHDWVRLAEAHGLVPNAQGNKPPSSGD